MHHLYPETAFPRAEQAELASFAYRGLITETSKGMPPNHDIVYVPRTEAQVAHETEQLTFAGGDELPSIMGGADLLVIISRDEDPNPDYTDRHPEYNITLTPSGRSNVDTSVDLYNLACNQGNVDMQVVATGRMHNRAVRSMLAVPVVAEHIGINPEDFYHMPEARFKQLLEMGFNRENIGSLQLNPKDPNVSAERKALISLFADPKYDVPIPTAESSDEDLKKAVDAVWQEYSEYPRVSTSRLMLERAVHRGVPLEAMLEEDGAVDTITNLVNVATMLESAEDTASDVRRVVIVAGSDHLPRTMWIADHILPDGIELVFVESDPALSQEAYDASCIRELNSFRKGSKWIENTRSLEGLTEITEAGYFGVARKDAAELAAEVAREAANAKGLGGVGIKHS